MRAGVQPLKGIPLALALSVSAMLPLAQPGPPNDWVTVLWTGVLCLCLWRARTRHIAGLLLPALLCQTLIMVKLHERLPAVRAGVTQTVTGTIAGLPAAYDDMQEFLFRPVSRGDGLPRLIRVRWYNGVPVPEAGQRWQLELRLQPPRGRVNFTGNDPERRFFAHGIGALGTVVTGEHLQADPAPRWNVHRWREALRHRMVSILEDEPAFGLILALSIGDRSRMSEQQWQTLATTGTGHLLAISGLHIGFAALLGFRIGWLSQWLIPFAMRLRLGLLPAWFGAIAAAVSYAGLAGFSVSTRRALVMLLVLMAARLTRRSLHPFQPWALALMLVLLLDPLAPLQPGYWMSFAAVAVLVWQFSPRTYPGGPVRQALLAQAAIMLVMLPLGMFWFQRVSVLSLPANLLAIPSVSLIIVPLVLAGLALLNLTPSSLAAVFLLPAAWAADGLVRALSWLASIGELLSRPTGAPAFSLVLLATAGLLFALWPRALRLRWLSLALLCPVLGTRPGQLSRGAIDLHLLDVGQGLAALIETPRQVTLYDTGPGQPGRWDLSSEVIEPAVRQSRQKALTRILVSHGDLDHAGGFTTLSAAFPGADRRINARVAAGRDVACNTGLNWDDSGVAGRILHPTPWLPYLGNLSSCVLSLRTSGWSLLLPGDIDHAVEERLVNQGLEEHDILVAPHHGSRTSSSRGFIRAVAPDWVLIPAGSGNRFGFPHAEVVQRYRVSGARVASVSDCGALRLRLRPGQTAGLESARRVRNAIWRWPPARECP